LCEANDAVIWRVDGDMLQRVAVCGPMPFADMRRPITRGTPPGRAVVDRQAIHVHDITAAELETEYSESKARRQISGSRRMLAVPLRREGVSIGAIMIRRTEVRPFSDKQKSSSSKLSPIRRSLRLRTYGCSKNSKNHWSSRLRLVRYSGSSPVR